MAAVEEEDPTQVRAAQILVSLRCRKLRRWPEWVPMQPSGPVSSSLGTVTTAAAAKVKMMPPGEASSEGNMAASVQLGRRPERVSMQLGVASLAGTDVLKQWPKGKRTGWRGETSRELEQGHAAKGSGAPRSIEQERCAEVPVAAALCYATVAVAGSGTGPTTSAVPAKESMKTPSPNSPLDYVVNGSGAPSTADDAAQAKLKGTGDDEGCGSPAKRGAVVAQEEKPVPISVEPSVQSGTRASFTGKGAPLPFDLNLPPCSPDDDDDGCPDTT